jgi:CheY-like chemotaxis protein
MQTEGSSLLSGLKVLIIDDKPEGLDVTKSMLSFYQAEVIPCLTAAEGLEQLQAQKPDVIVCELNMPQVNGYQFIKAVRNLPADKGGNTPAIALSVLSKDESADQSDQGRFPGIPWQACAARYTDQNGRRRGRTSTSG